MKTNDLLIINAAVMNANLASTPVPLLDIYGFAIQAVYTGTPTGTLKLQCSCDPFKNNGITPPAPTNWTDVTDSSTSISSAGSYVWNVTGAFYNFVRVVYTDGSSGSSTAVLTIRMVVKGM